MSDWFYYGTRSLAKLIYKIISGRKKISINGDFPDEPTLLTINHKYKPRFWFFGWREKWADHWLLSFIPTKRKIHFAVQDKQYMKAPTRFVLERLETFSTKEIRKGVNYVRNGETVAIFPQGEAHLLHKNRYYKGAAFIAKKGNVGITPIKIDMKDPKELNINIFPKIYTKNKTLEQITQEIKRVYSKSL